MYIPNAFSPNGDGINDVFTIYTANCIKQLVRFMIFDRNGALIYERLNMQTDNITGWNGTTNGVPMNPNVFVYVIEVEDTQGRIIMFKGDVTVLK